MRRTYTLDEIVDSGCSGVHEGGLEYSNYTKRIVWREEHDGHLTVTGWSPNQFYLLPQEGWSHVEYCVCRDCQ